MVRLYLCNLFFLSVLFSSSQGEFIIAGQTQDMIYTDFVPDYKIQTLNTSAVLDLNHDGINDIEVHLSYPQTPSLTYLYFLGDAKRCLVQNFLGGGMDEVGNKYSFGDTLSFDSDSIIFWQRYSSSVCKIAETCIPFFNGCYETDTVSDLTADYYYFVRFKVSADTLYGYIHLSFDSNLRATIYDFACQGPQSSYILSVLDDNFLSNNVKVSPALFSNYLHVDAPDKSEFSLYDLTGKEVMVWTDKIVKTEFLESGVYLLVVQTGHGRMSKKVVKL